MSRDDEKIQFASTLDVRGEMQGIGDLWLRIGSKQMSMSDNLQHEGTQSESPHQSTAPRVLPLYTQPSLQGARFPKPTSFVFILMWLLPSLVVAVNACLTVLFETTPPFSSLPVRHFDI